MFHAKHYFKKLQSHRLAIKYLWRIFKKIGVKKRRNNIFIAQKI